MPVIEVKQNRIGSPTLGDDILSGQRFHYRIEDWQLVSEWVKLMEHTHGVSFRNGNGSTLLVQPEGCVIPGPYFTEKGGIKHVAGPVVRFTYGRGNESVPTTYAAECDHCGDQSKHYRKKNEPALQRWASNHRCGR